MTLVWAAAIQDIMLAAALFGLGSAVHVRKRIQTSSRAIVTAMLAWILIVGLAYLGMRLL